jgi:hypothetical protein
MAHSPAQDVPAFLITLLAANLATAVSDVVTDSVVVESAREEVSMRV